MNVVALFSVMLYIFRMKKIVTILGGLVCVVCIVPAHAFNPFMGENENQIAVNIGQGVNSGFIIPPPEQFVPFYMLPNIQYSQPTTFFKLPARQSLNFGETVGMAKKYGWDWPDYSIPMIFASGDVALLYGCNWYLSAGAGVGLQAKQNERLGAKLLFQFKLIAGYRFTEHWGGEFFIQHFSNANTADENNSYAFYGLGVTYSF